MASELLNHSPEKVHIGERLVLPAGHEATVWSDTHFLLGELDLLLNPMNAVNPADPERYNWFHAAMSWVDESHWMVMNGDIVHLFPLIARDRRLIHPSMNKFADNLSRHPYREHIRYIPGNHDNLRFWSQQAITQLTDSGILVPGDGLDLVCGSASFRIIHGDEASKDEIANFPFHYVPVLQSILRIAGIGLRNLEHILPGKLVDGIGYIKDVFLNKNIIKWSQTGQVIPQGYSLITGHTHCPEFNPEKHYYNCGGPDLLFRNMSLLKIDAQGGINLHRIPMECRDLGAAL